MGAMEGGWNIKLKTRIKMICLSMGIAIVLASYSAMIWYSFTSLKSGAQLSLNAVNQQMMLTFDGIIDFMDEASLTPVLDPKTYNILKKDYSKADNRQTIYQDQDTIAGQLYNSVFYRNQVIGGITLIAQNSQLASYKNRQSRSPNLKDWEQQDWYVNLLKSKREVCVFALEEDQLYPQNEAKLCLARLLIDAGTDKVLGVVRVDINIKDLDYVWENALITQQGSITFSDSFGQQIYVTGKGSFTEVPFQNNLPWLTSVQQNETYHYQLTSQLPLSTIYQSATGTFIVITIAAILLIGAAFVLAEILSDRTMIPVRQLNRCMKLARDGDLSVRAKVAVGGEFGEICELFNSMAEHMQKLFQDILQEQEDKRKAEFLALQAQISPHFLLNTLNSIKWMAFLQGNTAIESSLSDLAKVLSFTFRDTCNKIKISTEIEQLEHYINILSMRYPNRFEVEFDVHPVVLDCYTLKYMVQPFLENSIFHGFNGMEGKGLLKISIGLENSCICYEIWDNGCGMEQNQIEGMLAGLGGSEAGKMNRIGVKNVKERIRLVYGNQYGIEIHSAVGVYTQVQIMIPAEYDIGGIESETSAGG